MSEGFFLVIIVLVSMAFLSISALMTIYMIRRRKKQIAKTASDNSLVDRYQRFLSNMIILPNLDDMIYQSSNQNLVTERLSHEDISNKYNRRILIQEIFSFKLYLQGNQAAQLVSYFYGLGLQEDVMRMLEKNSWTEKLMALKYIQTFDIKECLSKAIDLTDHSNKDLAFQALLTKLSLEDSFETITEYYTELTNWEKHKLEDLASKQGISITEYLPTTDSQLTQELVSI